ncbi:MAG TPA: amino acid ABC transporter ATP-binding protein [Atribacter sp.]|jgi:ABC-type polar amino acid transport system ATPase subunit|uniref:Glutamine transport ATP-binding protein GlnQ n=1 Tax=Candidatus Atribacter allofermentans TaxID=1852833 RepID=A0A1V5SJP2_9BACT|nr:amino acid ABC transporter ATP-binding protein [Atribacter sp.]MDI9594947.1 amino acid ABC transporter ATP-binding protein [Atribacterota bacterium]OQA54770.1 MAG: Glutamine transport ATP-binding protein GlnQ [Candidatus Atribacteria bacterium ADurb.Bin276]HQK83249.1 amino acid ABC transporter ATP-binding protein [Atribacter sp.]
MKKIIEINKLNKWFGKHHVLKDINLEVCEGDVLVLCGPSGAGKSTLLRCINLLENFQEGEILVFDKSIKENRANLRFIRKSTGMVFQHFNLFPHLTVLENTYMAPVNVKKVPKEKAIELSKELLNKVGILDKIDAYPEQLSGGQKQRVAIARALAMEPKLMLFDEPTSALDPEMIKEVLEVMKQLALSGMTMMIVSHEMGFAREAANKISFIDQGNIVEISDKDEFFRNPKHERTKAFLSKIL